MLRVSRVPRVFAGAPDEYVETFFHLERYQHYNELSSGPDGIEG